MTKILIVTGGSGGHVIPALTIFDHLKNNFDVRIATDERGTKFINKQDYEYNLIKVPNLFSNIWSLPLKLFKFIYVIFESYNYLKKNNISKIISTGGYMSFPFCFASLFLNCEIVLFEPNSVIGRSNKYMIKIAKKILCYDKNLKLFPKKYFGKIDINCLTSNTESLPNIILESMSYGIPSISTNVGDVKKIMMNIH